MNWKKFYSLCFLSLLILPLLIGLVAAAEVTTASWTTVFGDNWFGTFISYLFGPISEVTGNNVSNAIITVAVWLLVFITFGDIIATFSSFSKGVAWAAAGLIGIIAANLGWSTWLIAVSTGLFAFIGTAAVYAGLFAAFIAFFAVNWGIAKLGPWIMRRKAMTYAAKAESGGEKLGGIVAGFGKAGKELEKLGGS